MQRAKGSCSHTARASGSGPLGSGLYGRLHQRPLLGIPPQLGCWGKMTVHSQTESGLLPRDEPNLGGHRVRWAMQVPVIFTRESGLSGRRGVSAAPTTTLFIT